MWMLKLRRKLLIPMSMTLVVVISLLFVAFFLFTSSGRDFFRSKRNVARFYRLEEFNPRKIETSSRIVKLEQEMGVNDFISYETSTGTYVTISKFGGEKFHCEATCVCKSSDDVSTRRFVGTANVLKTGVTFIVTAFSMAVAIQMAKHFAVTECPKQKYKIRVEDYDWDKDFHDKYDPDWGDCEDMYREKDEEGIQCYPEEDLYNKDYYDYEEGEVEPERSFNPDEEEIDEDELDADETVETIDMRCVGRCKKHLLPPSYMEDVEKKVWEKKDCNSIELIIFKGWEVQKGDKLSSELLESEAREFGTKDLDPHCRNQKVEFQVHPDHPDRDFITPCFGVSEANKGEDNFSCEEFEYNPV